jgi:SAM-dependent methyltransferase
MADPFLDQAYRYAINLPCDWIVVTSMRETRLYYKGAQQNTYERFETTRLAGDEALLKRFVFVLGAERVVPMHRECHLYELLRASDTVGRTLTNQFYARYADIRQRVLVHLCRENAAVAPPEILRCTQKLLDRVLFCAFCEDRGLLPADSLKHAFEHRDPYNPHPVWHNFLGLFRAIDQGNAGLNIPAYNGGLFANDDALDALKVPDEVCEHFKDLGDYDYRPAREVADAAETTEVRSVIDVDILGHIFEQSITDLERLRDSLSNADLQSAVSPTCSRQSVGDGTASGLQVLDTADCKSALLPKLGKVGRRRKQEGAVYTPAFITRYLVEQALGGVLKQRFETLRRQHEAEAAGTARKTLGDPSAYDLATLNDPQRKALIRFWEAWQEELKRVRILDPACGSGAILIEAFDQLHSVFEHSNARLEELRGQRTLFDLDRQILQHNLYGVDLNAEAIQICQLSLWIKTAARGKQLTSLDHTIREGNSVISDPAVNPKAFDWQAAFPEVFAQGGFDIVVGNPPYIRQELLAPFKPYWELRFKSYHGVADIFVYFYEQGAEVLRPGGRLAFITSGSWVRANFGGGVVYRGVLSGLTEAFAINQSTRDKLVAADSSCQRFIRPFLQGTHLRPWYIEEDEQHLIALRSSANFKWPWSDRQSDAEQIFRETHPSVFEHLNQFRDAAIKRTDQGQFWWELRSCDYWDAFDGPKIVWPDISKLPRFSMDATGRYLGNTAYFIPTSDFYLLGVLSSWATWFFISKTSQPLRLRGDRWQYRLFTQSMENVPIPHAPEGDRQAIAGLAQKCSSLHPGPVNQKAELWWELSLNQLGDALKQSFKLPTNPMKNPRLADDWEPYLHEKRVENVRLSRALADAEAELNDRVYRLFDLTADEVKLVQKEVEH